MDAGAELVVELIEAFRRSKTMFTAVSMGVFDRLERGAAGAGELAPEMGADECALRRLLDGCAGLGLLVKHEGRYENSEAARRYLTSGSEKTLAGYILYSDRALYPMWGQLREAVMEGTNRWAPVFGPAEGGLFARFFHDEPAREAFLKGMHGLGQLNSPEVVRMFNLSRFKRMVDLGGATGHLAMAACERYGGMRAVVFDLEGVVPYARRYVEGSPAAARIEVEAGDFFTGPLPEGDLYALGRIVHDWSEERALDLLRRVHERLPVGGGVLLAEAVVDEDGCGPVSALMQSLNMLVCTEGRERTESEYRALLGAAGFGDVEVRRTGGGLDAILAVKKE